MRHLTVREAAFGTCFIIGVILACVECETWGVFVGTKILAAGFCLAALLLLPYEE
jgi:hypothetical protein